MATLTSMAMQTLVNQFGQEVTLRKPNYGSYDPSTGTVASTTNTDYTVKVYMAEYSLSEVNNDSILMGDRKALLAARDTSNTTIPEPDAEDQIIGFDDTVKVVSFQSIYHADTLACYICQVRE
jgi:hypothetical protein